MQLQSKLPEQSPNIEKTYSPLDMYLQKHPPGIQHQ